VISGPYRSLTTREPKRGDHVSPPTVEGEWDIRYGTTEAAKGWEELRRAAGGNARRAWELTRTAPGQDPGPRHDQLKGRLATAAHSGRELSQCQIEVTGGGRVWYLIDEDGRTVWLRYAGLGHPKETE
jgi:hypothetical protein